MSPPAEKQAIDLNNKGPCLLPNLPPLETYLGDKTPQKDGNLSKADQLIANSRIIGSYRVTKTLGQGTFGKVKEGIHMFT